MNKFVLLLSVPLLPLVASMIWLKNLSIQLDKNLDAYTETLDELHEEIINLKQDYVLRAEQKKNGQKDSSRITRNDNREEGNFISPDRSEALDEITSTEEIEIKKKGSETIMARVVKGNNGKFGYTDENGEIILSENYDQIIEYPYKGEVFLIIKIDNEFGAYSKNGVLKVPIKHESVEKVKIMIDLFFNPNTRTNYGGKN